MLKRRALRSTQKENSRIRSRKSSRDDLQEVGVSEKPTKNSNNAKTRLFLSPLETRNENKSSRTTPKPTVASDRRAAAAAASAQRRDAPSTISQASTASSRSRYRDANVLVPIRKQDEKLAKSTPILHQVPGSSEKYLKKRTTTRPVSSDLSNKRQKDQGSGGSQGEDLSRASSISNLHAESTTKGGRGALAKVRKSVSKDKLNDNVTGQEKRSSDKKGCNKNNNQLDPGEHEELQQKLESMANEKANLMLQLGDHKGQLSNLQKEIARLKMFQEQSSMQMEQLSDENAALRNKLRDVVHSPLSDNEKQMILLDSQRHHSSAPASIAANLLNDGGGGDVTTCSTPDWDKQSSSNVSEVSVACLQDKINQMQETHYSTNEELQATLQELTDLQRQLTELQQDNEHLLEEKNLMFESLCRQTERLSDARNEIESLKKLLYRDKDESGHDESAVEREQKLVDLLKNAQAEREMLLVKQEQLNNEIQEARTAFGQRENENLNLTERVRTLESTLDAKHAEHKQLDQDLARAKDKSSSRQIEIDRLTDLLENARTKIVELEQDRALSDKSELDELLDNARKEKDALESEVANLKEQLARGRNEGEKLREQVSILQEECKVLRNNAKCTQSELEYKVEVLTAEKNGLLEQLQGLEEAANELQVQAQCQLEDKRQLSSVLSETQRNMSEVERKNKELEVELKDIKKIRAEENEEWEKFQNDLLTSVRVANDFKNEAQQELQNLVLENKAHRDKIRHLEAQIEKLKESIGTAVADVEALRRRIVVKMVDKGVGGTMDDGGDGSVVKVFESGELTSEVGGDGRDIMAETGEPILEEFVVKSWNGKSEIGDKKAVSVKPEDKKMDSRDSRFEVRHDDKRVNFGKAIFKAKSMDSVSKFEAKGEDNRINYGKSSVEMMVTDSVDNRFEIINGNKIMVSEDKRGTSTLKDMAMDSHNTGFRKDIGDGLGVNDNNKKSKVEDVINSNDNSDNLFNSKIIFEELTASGNIKDEAKLKNLTKREAYYLKFIGEEYAKIDPSIAVENLLPDQQLIVKLKRGYDRHFAMKKAQPLSRKKEVAISKPLLASVYDNPKLKEIAENDDVPDMESLAAANVEIYSNLGKSKSKSLSDLISEDTVDRCVLKRAFISQHHLNRDSNMSEYQDSILWEYSDDEEIDDFTRQNENSSYPDLQELYEKIDKSKSESQLTKEELYVVKLKSSLDGLGRKNTLRRRKLKKNKLSISSPVLESVMSNEKLACILENPAINIAHEERSSWRDKLRLKRQTEKTPPNTIYTNKRLGEDVIYRYSLNSGAIKIESTSDEDTVSGSTNSLEFRPQVNTFSTFGKNTNNSGRSVRSDDTSMLRPHEDNWLPKWGKSASLTDIKFNFGGSEQQDFHEAKPHKDRDKPQIVHTNEVSSKNQPREQIDSNYENAIRKISNSNPNIPQSHKHQALNDNKKHAISVPDIGDIVDFGGDEAGTIHKRASLPNINVNIDACVGKIETNHRSSNNEIDVSGSNHEAKPYLPKTEGNTRQNLNVGAKKSDIKEGNARNSESIQKPAVPNFEAKLETAVFHKYNKESEEEDFPTVDTLASNKVFGDKKVEANRRPGFENEANSNKNSHFNEKDNLKSPNEMAETKENYKYHSEAYKKYCQYVRQNIETNRSMEAVPEINEVKRGHNRHFREIGKRVAEKDENIDRNTTRFKHFKISEANKESTYQNMEVNKGLVQSYVRNLESNQKSPMNEQNDRSNPTNGENDKLKLKALYAHETFTKTFEEDFEPSKNREANQHLESNNEEPSSECETNKNTDQNYKTNFENAENLDDILDKLEAKNRKENHKNQSKIAEKNLISNSDKFEENYNSENIPNDNEDNYFTFEVNPHDESATTSSPGFEFEEVTDLNSPSFECSPQSPRGNVLDGQVTDSDYNKPKLQSNIELQQSQLLNFEYKLQQCDSNKPQLPKKHSDVNPQSNSNEEPEQPYSFIVTEQPEIEDQDSQEYFSILQKYKMVMRSLRRKHEVRDGLEGHAINEEITLQEPQVKSKMDSTDASEVDYERKSSKDHFKIEPDNAEMDLKNNTKDEINSEAKLSTPKPKPRNLVNVRKLSVDSLESSFEKPPQTTPRSRRSLDEGIYENCRLLRMPEVKPKTYDVGRKTWDSSYRNEDQESNYVIANQETNFRSTVPEKELKPSDNLRKSFEDKSAVLSDNQIKIEEKPQMRPKLQRNKHVYVNTMTSPQRMEVRRDSRSEDIRSKLRNNVIFEENTLDENDSVAKTGITCPEFEAKQTPEVTTTMLETILRNATHNITDSNIIISEVTTPDFTIDDNYTKTSSDFEISEVIFTEPTDQANDNYTIAFEDSDTDVETILRNTTHDYTDSNIIINEVTTPDITIDDNYTKTSSDLVISEVIFTDPTDQANDNCTIAFEDSDTDVEVENLSDGTRESSDFKCAKLGNNSNSKTDSSTTNENDVGIEEINAEIEANTVIRQLTQNFLLIEQIMSNCYVTEPMKDRKFGKPKKSENVSSLSSNPPRIISSAFKNSKRNPEIVITPDDDSNEIILINEFNEIKDDSKCASIFETNDKSDRCEKLSEVNNKHEANDEDSNNKQRDKLKYEAVEFKFSDERNLVTESSNEPKISKVNEEKYVNSSTNEPKAAKTHYPTAEKVVGKYVEDVDSEASTVEIEPRILKTHPKTTTIPKNEPNDPVTSETNPSVFKLYGKLNLSSDSNGATAQIKSNEPNFEANEGEIFGANTIEPSGSKIHSDTSELVNFKNSTGINMLSEIENNGNKVNYETDEANKVREAIKKPRDCMNPSLRSNLKNVINADDTNKEIKPDNMKHKSRSKRDLSFKCDDNTVRRISENFSSKIDYVDKSKDNPVKRISKTFEYTVSRKGDLANKSEDNPVRRILSRKGEIENNPVKRISKNIEENYLRKHDIVDNKSEDNPVRRVSKNLEEAFLRKVEAETDAAVVLRKAREANKAKELRNVSVKSVRDMIEANSKTTVVTPCVQKINRTVMSRWKEDTDEARKGYALVRSKWISEGLDEFGHKVNPEKRNGANSMGRGRRGGKWISEGVSNSTIYTSGNLDKLGDSRSEGGLKMHSVQILDKNVEYTKKDVEYTSSNDNIITSPTLRNPEVKCEANSIRSGDKYDFANDEFDRMLDEDIQV